MSSETLLFDAEWTDGDGDHHERCVARLEPEASAVPVRPRAAAPRVMTLVGDRTKVPVPRQPLVRARPRAGGVALHRHGPGRRRGPARRHALPFRRQLALRRRPRRPAPPPGPLGGGGGRAPLARGHRRRDRLPRHQGPWRHPAAAPRRRHAPSTTGPTVPGPPTRSACPSSRPPSPDSDSTRRTTRPRRSSAGATAASAT